jgi:SAM-dependent methyltransferase
MSLFETTKPSKYRKKISESLALLFENYLNTDPKLEESNCPFCKSNESNHFFSLHSMIYLRCKHCSSIYNSPRPTLESLNNFYEMQPSLITDNEMLPAVRDIRIEKIMKPRWNLLQDKLKINGIKIPVETIMEVGANIGHFIQVLQSTNAAKKYIAVEPSEACEESLRKLDNTEVIMSTLEEASSSNFGAVDLLFLNSVIEHPHSLDVFFQAANNFLKTGGIISLVDMHSGGMDIELLKEDAQNVNPFLILQIGSIHGIKSLFERNGFKFIDVFSVGEMDADIIYEYSLQLNKDHPLFGLSHLLNNETIRKDLQTLLKKNLSTGYNGYLFQKIN